MQLDALVVGGLVGNWHSPGSHLHAVKEHARKDEREGYTGIVLRQREETRKETFNTA